MSNESFFDEQKEQSSVKSTIVSKYFWAWAKVIISVQNRSYRPDKRIAYIDLFAGPGCYEDNTKSTPLLVLEKAIGELQMAERLITFFNDRNPKNAKSLQTLVSAKSGRRNSRKIIPGKSNLTNNPFANYGGEGCPLAA